MPAQQHLKSKEASPTPEHPATGTTLTLAQTADRTTELLWDSFYSKQEQSLTCRNMFTCLMTDELFRTMYLLHYWPKFPLQ